MAEKLKKLWKNEYFQTGVTIGLIVLIVAGLFFGSKLVLNTDYPLLTVESGSMCVQYDGLCDGWSHPFDRTLHVGDVIIIQGVNTSDLNVGDIIVFHRPVAGATDFIVHHIITKQEINGTIYFSSKGDGNPVEDSWNPFPANLVIGKVIGRVPWIGNITLLMRGNTWGLPVIISLIIVALIIEFIIPLTRKNPVKQNENNAQL